jgi:hypothetical protein
LCIAGGVWGQTRRYTRIVITAGTLRQETGVDRPSPEQARRFVDAPGADRCRFVIVVPLARLPSPPLPIQITAVADDGTATAAGSVALIPSSITATMHDPIFVVGSPRSGTTAIGAALRRAYGLEGFGECHVLPMLPRLVHAATSYFDQPGMQQAGQSRGVMLAHAPPAHWEQGLIALVRATYEQLHQGSNFVDKTPGVPMLRAVPWIHRIWPQARVIYARRRGLENVESRRRKFGERPFREHCQGWAESMRVWDEVRGQIPAALCLELDQYDLAVDPAGSADRIAGFLAMHEDQCHRLKGFLARKRPEQTDAEGWKPLSWTSIGWDAAMKAEFDKSCRAVMEASGYSFDERYYARPDDRQRIA